MTTSGKASFADINEVSIGSAFAIRAAANDEMATGGVTIERILKYKTNIWAAIGPIPASIRAGASNTATIKYADRVGIPMPSTIHKTAIIGNRTYNCPPDICSNKAERLNANPV